MKKKILFVEDEPVLLESLKQSLQPFSDEWEMMFVSSGLTALAALEGHPVDVVVSDFKMPKMDGLAFLTEIKKKHADTVRIMLTDSVDPKDTFRISDVAHQFLKKPCGNNIIHETIVRSCDIQSLLNDKVLRQIVGKVQSLPTLPAIYTALSQALADPDVELKQIAGIVEKDIALNAKILQMVNSPYFGLPRKLSNILGAVSFLGINTIKNLALSIEAFRGFKGVKRVKGFSFDNLQEHALMTAHTAMSMLTDRNEAEQAFTAGMLHDIGKLILASHMPEQFEAAIQLAQERDYPIHYAEKELFGATHAEMGAYLLGLWGLPYPVIEAVAFHHSPIQVEQHHFDILGAVYVADKIVRQSQPKHDQELDTEFDAAYLEKLGVTEQIPVWQAKFSMLSV